MSDAMRIGDRSDRTSASPRFLEGEGRRKSSTLNARKVVEWCETSVGAALTARSMPRNQQGQETWVEHIGRRDRQRFLLSK
jgi:hypothetical protein